jgi:peptidoglycan/LPS O-acetylase OafA/YrhL
MLHDAILISVFKPLWTWLALRPDQFGLYALACCVILTVVADRTYAYFENPARRLINRWADIGAASPRKAQAAEAALRFDNTERAVN